MFSPALLFRAPEVNPVNHKARSIPLLNPVNVYGRVFFFAWFGFFVAFWSWYAFPPLINVTIAKDLHLTTKDISNSNIIALVATLLVRVIAGPACDRFGARHTFAACLLAGAIPTALAGAVYNTAGLLALRFFIGILGGSFVPCQVWSTGFFDKNVVGTSNALTAGFGNAGGGVTYFVMPAIYDSLLTHSHFSPHKAWRVTFVVPFIVITATALALLFCCPDTPTGKWKDRQLHAEQALANHGITGQATGQVVDVPGEITDKVEKPSPKNSSTDPLASTAQPAAHTKASGDANAHSNSTGTTTTTISADPEKGFEYQATGKRDLVGFYGHEAHLDEQAMLDTARGEIIRQPTFREALPVIISLQTLNQCACYFTSFGAELAINSILGAYYLKNFADLGQAGSGRWAAMFGLLNVVARPFGGITADAIYRHGSHSERGLWGKKIWLHFLCLVQGAFLIAIGVKDPHKKPTMFGLVAGMAGFLEAANGANFALVPHVHPHANGIVSGFTGGAGNFGGIIFAIIFRFYGKDYHKVFWIIGIMTIAINLSVCWIRPIPKGQIGGH